MQWVWENLSLFQNKEVFWKQLGGCCHLSFLSISKLTNSNFVLLDIWKVQLINAYMFIDFSSSFCPLGASKLKEKKKSERKIFNRSTFGMKVLCAQTELLCCPESLQPSASLAGVAPCFSQSKSVSQGLWGSSIQVSYRESPPHTGAPQEFCV